MTFLKNRLNRPKTEPRIGPALDEPNKTFNAADNATQRTQSNPFLGAEGRREWSDRYGDMAKHIRGWQGAFGVAMLAIMVLVVVNVKLSTQSRIQPFAVELNQGVPVAIQPMNEMKLNDPHIVHFFIEHFMENVRTVVSDVEAQKHLLNSVYAFAAEKTLPFLKEYYMKNNPLERAQSMTVHVHVINILPLSDNTCQVIWEETSRNIMNGDVLQKTRWLANVTYKKTGKVSTDTAKDNPFGLYITNLTWSQSQGGENI